MKRIVITFAITSLISMIFATTMIVHTTNGEQEFELSDITSITFENEVNPPENMIFVQGGTFDMGSNNGDDDEQPIHNVTVSDFYIGKYEVTQAEYEAITGNNPSHDYGVGNDYPVYYVNWYEAIAFCNAKSESEGLTPCYSGSGDDIVCNWEANGYRLPTEAEWEYAARGGILATETTYAGSDNIDEVSWYDGNSGSQTNQVGIKQPNELGIYDMSGNVWEWCWDRYSSSYYSNSPSNNPHGADDGFYRVLRGGSWDSYAISCRVARRGYNFPSFCSYDMGFRVLRR